MIQTNDKAFGWGASRSSPLQALHHLANILRPNHVPLPLGLQGLPELLLERVSEDPVLARKLLLLLEGHLRKLRQALLDVDAARHLRGHLADRHHLVFRWQRLRGLAVVSPLPPLQELRLRDVQQQVLLEEHNHSRLLLETGVLFVLEGKRRTEAPHSPRPLPVAIVSAASLLRDERTLPPHALHAARIVRDVPQHFEFTSREAEAEVVCWVEAGLSQIRSEVRVRAMFIFMCRVRGHLLQLPFLSHR
mmetsp:Transcript_1789/g.6036  ORF Transcript_1789/g.6036 Transcript_1789/m.6036 type:complete len:248 (+) Transcript_1789:318-1061(+)